MAVVGSYQDPLAAIVGISGMVAIAACLLIGSMARIRDTGLHIKEIAGFAFRAGRGWLGGCNALIIGVLSYIRFSKGVQLHLRG